jgi:hypothetical protein
MQRWTAVAFLVLVASSVGVLWLGRTGGKGGPQTTGSATVAADAAPPGDAASAPPTDAGAAPEEEAGALDEPGRVFPTTDAGATLLNGEAPPPLPADAPKAVTFGVILVQYRGAQGAPPKARSREEALALVKELAVEAKQDFKAAVKKGDKGSVENAGKIQRGYLEPAPEYVLFSLAKDAVSDPVDTPRGFWIAKRID